GKELIRQPPQPGNAEDPVPLAHRQQQQDERRDQYQQRVHRQDVGAVVGVVEGQGTYGDFGQAVDAQAEVAAGPQSDVGVQVQDREDQSERDRGQVQGAGSNQGVGHSGDEA